MVRNVLKRSIAITLSLAFFAAPPALSAPDTKIALVPGGPHPYFAAWAQAGKDATRDFMLGKADYRVPPRWEVGEQNALIESLSTQGYNGFLIFAGDAASVGTVAELSAKGSKVIATAGCFKDPSQVQFCLGTDTGNSAYLGTKELIKLLPGKKRIAHFTGFRVDPNTQPRIDEVNRAAKEGGAEVVQVIVDVDAPEPAAEKIGAYMSSHAKDIDGIITTAWVPAVEAANQLRKIGDKRIKMVGIDHDEVVLKAIKDGYVTGTMLQNPYGQGYIGAYALDKLLHGCKVNANAPWKGNALTKRFIDSGSVYVDVTRVDAYVTAMQGITKTLFTKFEQTYLDCKK
jgi:ribose transport system substrate-binding protein